MMYLIISCVKSVLDKVKICHHFLFSIYINDLEEYLLRNGVNGFNCPNAVTENYMFSVLKLFILLYADDTVLLSESANDLQHALDVFSDYCDVWKLHVNNYKNQSPDFFERLCEKRIIYI